MIHQRQRLPLGLEARHHFARVHAGFDQLDGDAAAHGLLLLGQPDFAHAALANPLQQMIGTDDPAGGRLSWCDGAGDDFAFAVLCAR